MRKFLLLAFAMCCMAGMKAQQAGRAGQPAESGYQPAFSTAGFYRLPDTGRDVVTIVAAVADQAGHIKRLSNQHVLFTVQGEGRLLGDVPSLTNPRPVQWGTAPILLQSTMRPGRIRVTASLLWQGKLTPVSAQLELSSVAPVLPLVGNPDQEATSMNLSSARLHPMGNVQAEAPSQESLDKVSRQQTAFE